MSCCKDKNQERKHQCVECDVPQRTRNNYFTGKLMTERDFKDEQRYFIGKERRHNQRLHGYGTVCGLKVAPHTNTACQDQYVVIEPGLAIDCCGREILVKCEENFDFKSAFLASWQAANGKDSIPDALTHTIQICVRYQECLTEEVPALFDDCGCDDTACKPNRILESYAFDVIRNPKSTTQDPGAVQLQWDGTIAVADPVAVAVTSQTVTPKVFVLWQPGASATITTFDAGTGGPLDSNTFANLKGLDLAVSPDGAHLYVALQPAAGDPQIQVLDAANLATPPVATLTVTGAGAADIRLAVAPKPDARLFAAVPSLGQVWVWGTDINTSATPGSPTKVTTGTKPVAIAFNQNGSWAYTADNGGAGVTAIKASDLTTTALALAGLSPTAIAVLTTAAGDNLAVLDSAAPNLTLVAFRPGTATPVATLGSSVTAFPHTPVALNGSPHGNWIYLLERDATDKKAYLQTADPSLIAAKQPSLGPTVPVGIDPGRVVIDAAGAHLYATFQGATAATGGVAVVDILGASCKDLFLQVLEPCPDCDQGDCIVLATIKEYAYGSTVTAPQIDNLTDRHLLPSTEVLTEVIECILEHQGGTAPGIPGPKGDNGDAATIAVGATVTGAPGTPAKVTNSGTSAAAILDFTIPQGSKGDTGQAATVTVGLTNTGAAGSPANVSNSGTSQAAILDFTIPKGDKGDKGDSFTPLDLPHIIAINWPHDTSFRLGSPQAGLLAKTGLIIAFDKPMQPATINKRTFELHFRSAERSGSCFCPLVGVVAAGNTPAATPAKCGDTTINFVKLTPGTPATAAQFMPQPGVQGGNPFTIGQYRVIVKGDFILGDAMIGIPQADGTLKKRNPALDADHMGPGLPARCPTGDGIEGGTFESWFDITD